MTRQAPVPTEGKGKMRIAVFRSRSEIKSGNTKIASALLTPGAEKGRGVRRANTVEWSAGEMRVSRRNIRADRNVRAIGRRVGMDITWLDDRIAVGGGIWKAENMAEVSHRGITHIINMQIEFPDDTILAKPHGIAVCWIGVDDDFEEKSPEIFERGVDFALRALKEPQAKLFIHCAAGVHRAPMMALALLAVRGLKDGKTVERAMEDAMDLIERKRSAADFADVYVRSVETFLNRRG
jgi:protein tyrosine phosphatase (PTP) superfamily phosphohydrolase (DUF442 family)